MPPRSGQMDEISEAIGRLSGQVDSLDRYTHEREHGLNNLTQKVDGLGTLISREIAAVEARIKVRFEQVEERLTALEVARNKQDGARGVWVEILKSPIVAGTIGGLLAAVGMAWALLSGKPH